MNFEIQTSCELDAETRVGRSNARMKKASASGRRKTDGMDGVASGGGD